MLYHVVASFDDSKTETFFAALTDGTIESQKPDGREILASMQRAVVREVRIEWTETCHCNPPLQHERETVYDRYFKFKKIEAQPIDEDEEIAGDSFWERLSSGSRNRSGGEG